MVGIIVGAIVLLDIRHQVLNKVTAEGVTAKAHLSGNLLRAFLRCGTGNRRWGVLNLQLHRIAVWHDDNHLLGRSFGYHIIKDIVHTTNLVVHFLSIRRTTNQVEHWILLLEVLHIVGWQIDDGIVSGT